MNVKGIGSSNIINLYNKNNNKVINKGKVEKNTDRIEISSIGRSLHDYSLDDINIDNNKKIAEIKIKIASGTYKVDSKLLAQSIIDIIKEKKI
ncbi:flagellar biosynthesis anti-sigma factor FlgM [uncultured Clostridium sp.]|uniref:flagellar biosynthesis anti-sigma factor FlgM n=1 Tax=uncultured Clostridium sp. TaxID=59620 RepID=UPI0025E4F64D|nr:flagellar biosynthesis anti-sigma factor FlgM [uncultured Clostridium sp.]